MAWSDAALKQLASWGNLSPDAADYAGMFEVEDASAIFSDFHTRRGIILPYFYADGEPMPFTREGQEHHFCRVRYIGEEPKRAAFVKHKPMRYGQPTGSGVRAYFPPVKGMNWVELLGNVKQGLVITEGEAKSLAATLAGWPTVGLGGVYNWRHEGELRPELAEIKWGTRATYLAFDSDAQTNPQVQLAEARLVDELMRLRKAEMYVVRLPHALNGDKMGLDTFLAEQGPDRFEALLRDTPALGNVDAAIVALNRHVAWIERDSLVYDLTEHHFLRVDAFQKGSRYSTEKVLRVVNTGKAPGVKEVSVATTWLTHHLAQRYADLLFRPGEGPLVETDNGSMGLNVWHGWDAAPGDVQPFLDLTEFLMRGAPEQFRDLPLKLVAYKAQHPEEKVPLALVLIGDPGSGKTLWTECLQAAFAPYAVTLPSSALRDNFNGWMERSLLACINEVEPEDLEMGQDRLKALVSDMRRPMNEKYRPARQINSYTMYILTANKRAAGAFSHSDRRMIVFGIPPEKQAKGWYDAIGDWLRAGGGRAICHYLLTYDLKGWRPPQSAPVTPEKAMAYQESLTPVQKLAYDCETATENTIMLWLDSALTWANATVGGGNPTAARYAQEIIDSYSQIQIRPWYSPDEIAMMFPQIAAAIYGNKKVTKTISGEISREMRDAGVPYLESSDDMRGFLWRGRIQQFLVLAQREEYRHPITQADFERAMANWPRYCDVKAQMRQKGKVK